MCGFLDVRIGGCADVRIGGLADGLISGFKDIRTDQLINRSTD